jgi:hypothetical protein
MNKDQRIQLVGLIHQYGGAMSVGDREATATAIAAIRNLLDELTDEPNVVEIEGVKFEI